MDKTARLNNSSQTSRRRGQELNISDRFVSNSRSSSPNRNVKTKRAAFESNTKNTSVVKPKNEQTGGNRINSSRNLSPPTRNYGDVEIENQEHSSNSSVAERIRSIDEPATGESLVQAFSRLSRDAEDERNEIASPIGKSTSLERGNTTSGTSNTDRSTDVRYVSGYGSVFSKLAPSTEKDKASLQNNKISETKVFGRRTRERAAARNKRMQAQKEEPIQNREEIQTKGTSKQYVPSYVQPVAAAFTKVQTGPVIDICSSQIQTAVRQTSSVLQNDSLKKSELSKDKITSSHLNFSRLSSSGSSDEDATTYAQKSKLFSSGEPLTSGTFDNTSAKPTSREVKRTRRRIRKAQRQTNPQVSQSSSSPSGQTMSNIAQRMQFFQPSSHSQNQSQDFGVSSKTILSTKPTTCRSRTKHRKQGFVETEEKYSTLPANFSLSDVNDNGLSNKNQLKSGALKVQQANTSDSKYDHTGPLNELMITHKQIQPIEDDKKKSYVLRPNSVNQSKGSQSEQHIALSSTGIDRSSIAGGSQESIDKTPPLPPQTKSKQVENLRSLFNSEEVPKIEFGQAYNKQEPQQKSTLLSKNAVEGQKSNDQAVPSQPMLKAVKLSEHYWPKDEATEKLFIRNNAHSSESNKRASHTLETVDEMSDLSNQAVTDNKEVTVSPGSSEFPNSPKETNLNDPVLISKSERWPVHSKKHSVSSQGQDSRKATPCTTFEAPQTASHYDVIPERTVRSQSLDSGADAYLREKLPSSQWSFDDPDSKLKAYENSLNAADKISNTPLSAENPEVSSAGCIDLNAVSEVDLNVVHLRNVYINGVRLYPPPKFNESNEDLQTLNTVASNQLDYDKTQDYDGQISQPKPNRSKSNDDSNLRFTNLKSSAQNDSNTTQPIFTSTRKNSVVSRSTALPRNSAALAQEIEAGEIDEGCVIEEATVPKSVAMKAALFKHSNLAQGNSSRNEDRNESGVCSTPNSRRRRKFSAAGQNNSDSSNTSNNSESSRSLSDPIPNRKKSSNGADEETGPIDSNFQYPLKPGGCVKKEDPELNNSTSDLSGYSENTSIQSDFNEIQTFTDNEPHAIEQALAAYDAKTSSNPVQKRYFSNPNASTILEACLLNKETGRDKASVCSSSSEQALSEPDEDDESSPNRRYSSSQRSNSDRSWDNNVHTVGIMTQSLEDMSHSMSSNNRVSQSPRLTRKLKSNRARRRAKNSRNRNDNLQRTSSETTDSSTSTDSESDPVVDNALEHAQEQFQTIYNSMSSRDSDNSTAITNPVAHSRSCSAPAGGDDLESILSRKASGRGRRPGIVQAPSLSDVLQKDHALQTNLSSTKPLSNSTDGLLAATFPRTAASRGLDYEKYGKGREKLDMRRLVVGNLLETEASYVNSLRTLFEIYYQPLKRPENHSICEPRLVDEIFFQIPQILQHHEKFYANVLDCVEHWGHADIKMGEVFIQSFNKDKLLESYTNYTKNFMNAKLAVNAAIGAKSAFKIFLEQCQRENKEKQGLSDLMIKPVQRIPRYELIIKDLLKHTPEGHPDRASLLIAQQEIHALSVQMNRGEKVAEAAERHARLLQEIEQLIEGNIDIGGTSKRKFLHQAICNELKNGNKKERSLWLFNDMLMCTTSKKSGKVSSLRRSSTNLYSVSPDRVMIDFTCRYKFIWKFPLDDVDLLKGSIATTQQPNEKLLQQLQTDQELIHKVETLAEKIYLPHVQLDEAIKDLLETATRRINERQQQSRQSLSLPGRLEIGIPTPDGMKVFQFEFATEDGKAQFEHLFSNARKNFTSYKRKWEPTFLKAIPISKTRNGMQFSCAAPNIDTSPGAREVWVCNTDGYVGQICILSLEPEPVQSQCLTVCNAKIYCIEQVPTWATLSTQRATSVPKQGVSQTHHRSSSNNLATKIIAWDDTDESEEDNSSPMSTISNCSPNNTMSSIDEEIILPIMSPLLSSHSLCRRFGFSANSIPALLSNTVMKDASNATREASSDAPGNRVPNAAMRDSLGSGAYMKDSDGSTLHGSLDDLLTDNSISENGERVPPSNGSMWLGTDDGKINMYSTTEALRTCNRPDQLSHSASVQCILHHGGQVFVALNNGDLVIYHRNAVNGKWEFNNKKCIPGTSPNSPIMKMVVVNDKELWCGCQNQVTILDIKNHNPQSFFSVTQDSKRQINCMVCYGFGVWVALDKRPQIKLFHSVTHALIAEVDVSHPVSKMLASADAIIRQHKAACLKVTSLLVCNNLVWVGTSAGVVLTMALPTINVATTSLPLPVMPQGLPYGHTGHVRFLTSVETLDQESPAERPSTRQRQRSVSASTPTKTNTLVISGGDGYEDFRMNSANEVAGREDSTNHLLVWKMTW